MACSKVQGGVTLFGEGAHGYPDPEIGRLIGGLWLVDLNALRWVALSPGTDPRRHSISIRAPVTSMLGMEYIDEAANPWRRGRTRSGFTIKKRPTDRPGTKGITGRQ